MKKAIAVLPGDGVGPEVTQQAVAILKKVGEVFGHEFSFKESLIGAAAIEKTGEPLPKETLDLSLSADAILFGAIGDPKYDDPNLKVRPEQGLLKLRESLGLYANIRPIYTFLGIKSSPLKEEIVKNVDFVIVRELTGGLYFGKPRGREGNRAFETNVYTKEEIERVSEIAFSIAKARKDLGGKFSGKVTLVDKANVLETSRLWRETVRSYAQNYPDVTLEYMYVDNASAQIMKRPSEFDVILTDNIFGDILSDEASVISGSIGLLPSASVGEKISLYEPIHGSFPKAAGQNIANPVGAILSAAMMLEKSFQLVKESQAVFKAVRETIAKGYGTKDIASTPLGTKEFGNKIIEQILKDFGGLTKNN